MNQSSVVAALHAVGERLAYDAPELERVEMVVIGGAAGLLSGSLSPDRTTTDCDVLSVDPSDAKPVVLAAAQAVAEQIGLGETWLNDGGAPWADGLPRGWRDRCREVLRSGPLIVHAIGRVDLMALKLLAGRAQDIEDLVALQLSPAEVTFLGEHLGAWSDDSWPRGMIDEALVLLEALASGKHAQALADSMVEAPSPVHRSDEEAAHGSA
ncbi:MAG: hypothetical protein KDA22_06545 [Phycisphaerales bacterium]|nr:hypothetical protein [Phycisphaerales bacterium]